MKKLCIFVLLMLAVFIFAACAGNDENGEENDDNGYADAENERDFGDPSVDESIFAPEPEPEPLPPASATMNTTISPADFVNSIGAGWNLGNAFDAIGDGTGFGWIGTGVYADTSVIDLETAWTGGPRTAATRELFEVVQDAGFSAIRIPVSWNKVSSGPDYEIREDWMERVREVVQWAYDLDMYIILNTHHENRVILLTDDEVEHSIHILSSWWTQIANEFMDFEERLMFAGLNEPRGRQGEWTGGVPETRNNLNLLNQAFVDAVRATGGNNAYRFLIVPTHAASATENAFNGFEIPTDPAERVILAIHTYTPFNWAHDGRGEYTGPAEIQRDLERVAARAETLGVPVILSEWGFVNNGEENNLAQREQHAYDYVSIARSLGMSTFWWDNNSLGDDGNHTFGLFNRATREVLHPTIIAEINRAFSE